MKPIRLCVSEMLIQVVILEAILGGGVGWTDLHSKGGSVTGINLNSLKRQHTSRQSQLLMDADFTKLQISTTNYIYKNKLYTKIFQIKIIKTNNLTNSLPIFSLCALKASKFPHHTCILDKKCQGLTNYLSINNNKNIINPIKNILKDTPKGKMWDLLYYTVAPPGGAA